MSTDDIAAQIIAGLAAEAEFIDGGGFTIDPEAARKKLADRQLADPDAWILLILEAAELLGVDRIEIRERPAGLRIRLLGEAGTRAIKSAELGELFTWVFAELTRLDPGQRRVARARQLLALGLNAALSRPVRSVALACITPEEGRRILLRPDAPGAIGAIEPGPCELEIRFDALLDSMDTPTQAFTPRPELVLVAERCGWGEIPIEVLGRAVPRQPALAKLRVCEPIECDGELIGRAEFIVGHEWPKVAIVGNGVLLESVDLPGWGMGFRAILTGGFERDLSLGRAIRDATFERSVAAVRAAYERLVAELGRRGQTIVPATPNLATVPKQKQDALAAMFNDPGKSRGHNALWASLGAGFMAVVAIGQSAVLAGVLGGIALLGGGVALYFLRMRKVFGDEG